MSALEGLLDELGADYNPDRGGDQQIRCPFHEDTHASASVNLDKGVLNCFGCMASGDTIELLMDYQGLDFVEALKRSKELAKPGGREVSHQSGRSNSLLPSRSGSKPGRRNWSPPWAGSRAR